MRLRKECEHGRYDTHRSFSGYLGKWGGYDTCPGGEFLSEGALRSTVFSTFMQFLGLHEEDTDDQLYATEFTDRVVDAFAEGAK